MANKVTVYRSSELGSAWPPVYINQNITHDGQRSYKGIYEILKTCLVDGYAGKPGAGWTMLYDEIATGAGWRYALKNASGSGVLAVEAESNFSTKLIVCEDAIAPGVYVNDWSFQSSAANGQNGYFHFIGVDKYSYNWNGTDYRSYEFIVVATENSAFVYLFQKSDDNAYSSGYSGRTAFYIGAGWFQDSLHNPAPLLGNFVALGGGINSSSNPHPAYDSGIVRLGASFCISLLRNADGSSFTTYPGGSDYGVSIFSYFSTQSPTAGQDVNIASQLISGGVNIGKVSSFNTFAMLPIYTDIYHAHIRPARALLRHLNQWPAEKFGHIVTHQGREWLVLSPNGSQGVSNVSWLPMDAALWP